jgi:hypothetical protein
MVEQPHCRRLAALCRHMAHHCTGAAAEPGVAGAPYVGGTILAAPLSSSSPATPPSTLLGLTDAQQAAFVARGFVHLGRQQLGTPAELHRRIHARQRASRESGGFAGSPYGSGEADNMFNHMAANPGVLEVLRAPALVAAVASILGPDWAIVPYANTVIEADHGDQHWHKDDIMPWNARKAGLRQHHAEHLNLFYYPQDGAYALPVVAAAGPGKMSLNHHTWPRRDRAHGADCHRTLLELLDRRPR